MSRHIFISYRRADSEGYAGRLFDRLSSHFGARNIFMDVAAIEAGVDFAKEIEQAVRGCDVLLALIGPQWLIVKDGQGNLRLEDPGDYVRLEIATALGRGIRVIPVLLQGAPMPGANALPEDLKALAMRNAITLSATGFHTDTDRLVEAIERALAERDADREKSTQGPVPPSPMQSLHQLPLPPADFTGREELIAQLLTDFEGGKGPTITGLTGMGGIGKTSLGLVVAGRVAKDYPDAQIFLDLKGTTTPLSALDVVRHVIRSFEPTMDLRRLDEGDETGMLNVYRSLLQGKRALLFLDNVRSSEQIVPLRPPETCALLVTSRWTFSVPGLHTRRLDLMSEENAKAFLLELCPRVGEQADRLARACGYLPLALRIAGSFLGVNEHWNVKEYIDGLSDRKGRLATLGQSREEAELKTEPDLLATFELSYSQLSNEDRRGWRTLGVFPASFDWAAARAMGDLDENRTRKLLGLLLRYSLLEYDEPSSRYSLHDLLTDYALSQMAAEEQQEARLQHASYYAGILSAANDLYLEGGEKVLMGLLRFDLEWENIRTGQAWAASGKEKNTALAKLCITYPNAGIYVLDLRQHPKERIQWLETGLSSARETGDRPSEAAILGRLGSSFRDLGEVHKAIKYYEQRLTIARELGDRRSEGAALGSLGNAYSDLGEVRKAVDYQEKSLTIAREIGARRGEGKALGDLGSAYHALGEVQRAIEYYDQALTIAREIGARRSEGEALGNLGSAYRDLGEIHKAIENHQQSLTITREIGDRLGEGITLGNLGIAYHNLGEVRKAIEFFEQYLVIAREIGDRRGEGKALGNLGVAYRDLGEIRKAIEFHKGHLVIAREIGDRRGEGQVLGNLGNAYTDLGDVRKAIEFFEQDLAIAREIGDRRGEGSALGDLGAAYHALGEVRKAIEFHEQRLAIAREIGNRRGEGRALGGLGIAYRHLGEVRKAIEFHEQDLAIAREIGDRHGEEVTLGNLGIAYRHLGEVRKAIELYEQRLAIAREIGDRLSEGMALGNLGNAYRDLGEVDKAIAFHEQGLAIAREIGDRRGEGRTLGNVGIAYRHLGEVHKAIEFYEQGLAIAREIGDRRGEGTALGSLGLAYHDLGELRRAIEFYEQDLAIAREIGDRHGEGNVLFNMGLVLYDLEEKDRAIHLVKQALEIYEVIESPDDKDARKKLKEWGV
jgi:tetratricopeptide (TPR) repeat protein